MHLLQPTETLLTLEHFSILIRNDMTNFVYFSSPHRIFDGAFINPYQYGLYSNLIGMGGGRHVFFNFDTGGPPIVRILGPRGTVLFKKPY